jgi:hypothetical protein
MRFMKLQTPNYTNENSPVTKQPIMHQTASLGLLKRSDITYTPIRNGISSIRMKAIVSIAWVVRNASGKNNIHAFLWSHNWVGTYGLWEGSDLYRATPAATRDPSFCGFIRSPWLLHLVASYDKQGIPRTYSLPDPITDETRLWHDSAEENPLFSRGWLYEPQAPQSHWWRSN